MKPNVKLILKEIEEHKRENGELKLRIQDLGSQLNRLQAAVEEQKQYHGVLLGYIRELEGGDSIVLKRIFQTEFKEYNRYCAQTKQLVTPHGMKKRTK